MEYSKLCSEVQDLINLVNNDPQNNHKPTGWRIMYSPVIPKAKVLLIGINPGGGIKEAKIEDTNLQLEYLDSLERNYELAGQTVEMFRRIGKFEILENQTAKTNCHYFVSHGLQDFKPIFKDIVKTVKLSNSKGESYLSLTHQWNRAMIFDIINPEVIICEGKGAYDYVLAIMPELCKPVMKEPWDGYCGLHKAGNKWILGYARRYSDIKNIKRVSEVLAPIL